MLRGEHLGEWASLCFQFELACMVGVNRRNEIFAPCVLAECDGARWRGGKEIDGICHQRIGPASQRDPLRRAGQRDRSPERIGVCFIESEDNDPTNG
jgi:hypothetical protein